MKTKTVISAVLALWVGLLLPVLARAQGQQPPPQASQPDTPDKSPISPERPGFTNGTDTVPPGSLQFEIGYAYSGSGNSHLSQLGNGAQLRVPITERAEVRLGVPSYQWAYASGQSTQSGFTDTSLSAKVRFLDGIQGHRPSLAVIGTTTLPDTGSSGFRDSHAIPTVALESHYDFSGLWNVETDYVYTNARDNGQSFTQGAGALCVSYNVTQVIGTFLEAYRISPNGIGAPNGNYVDSGVTYVVGNNTQYDISAGRGLSKGVHSDFFVGAGYARRF